MSQIWHQNCYSSSVEANTCTARGRSLSISGKISNLKKNVKAVIVYNKMSDNFSANILLISFQTYEDEDMNTKKKNNNNNFLVKLSSVTTSPDRNNKCF